MSLKLASAIFLTNFCFPPNDSPSEIMRCFLFHLQSSFRDIQILAFPSSPLFLSVSHCFRAWSKVHRKVYEVISCLNKKLTHFVWYLEKKKSYDIETLTTDRILNGNIFMRKSCLKYTPKASPRPPFLFW